MQPKTKSNLNDLPMSDGDEDVLNHEFCIETHLADAMPASHWHDHVEINYLWSGSLSYLINGERLTLQAGELCIFWAATPHQVIAVEDAPRLSCAYVPLSMFLALQLQPDFRQGMLLGQVYFGRDHDGGDQYLFARWTREWNETGIPQRHILEEEVQLRVRRLSWSAERARGITSPARAVGGKDTGRRAVAQAEAMTSFVHERLDQGVTVREVVLQSGLHATNAHAAFQRVLGMSIGEYIRRQRLRHAMRLLVDTDIEIAQIAYDSGYTSTGRLYDAFQKRLGKTPRRYRQEFREKAWSA